MRKASIVCIVLLLAACSDKIELATIANLNGYWEIEKVTFPDGNSKEYNINTTVDYFEVKELKGFRKKVQPKFNGTYETSDDAANFSILEKEGLFTIYYSNDLSEWTEQLTQISANTFSVRTEDGILYQYKRFNPINATK